MLKLRRATVVDAEQPRGVAGSAGHRSADGSLLPLGEQRLVIELVGTDGPEARRAAVADLSLVGPAEVGDEVIVNVEALDLGLGSGGFDVVHVNLTRGLDGVGEPGAAVMKLNYTSIQHAVAPVDDAQLELPLERPVAVLALHGQLAAVAWAFARDAPGQLLGYVQAAGGALPGGHSRTVRTLREQGLLAGHLTAAAAFGGEGEAI